MLRKTLLVIGTVLLVVVAGGAVFVATRQHLKFDAPYPKVAASSDSAIVERGHYIVRRRRAVRGVSRRPYAARGIRRRRRAPLIGGFVFDIPPGKFYPRNLTPDAETGLGNVADSAIARALRFGVGHDGRALLPFMEMQGLADDDLQAVVSYLRTQAPVRNPVPPHHFNVLGKVVKATVLANPVGPSSPPPAHAPRGASVETGKYLVESVALCWACHTQRNPNDGRAHRPALRRHDGLH